MVGFHKFRSFHYPLSAENNFSWKYALISVTKCWQLPGVPPLSRFDNHDWSKLVLVSIDHPHRACHKYFPNHHHRRNLRRIEAGLVGLRYRVLEPLFRVSSLQYRSFWLLCSGPLGAFRAQIRFQISRDIISSNSITSMNMTFIVLLSQKMSLIF